MMEDESKTPSQSLDDLLVRLKRDAAKRRRFRRIDKTLDRVVYVILGSTLIANRIVTGRWEGHWPGSAWIYVVLPITFWSFLARRWLAKRQLALSLNQYNDPRMVGPLLDMLEVRAGYFAHDAEVQDFAADALASILPILGPLEYDFATDERRETMLRALKHEGWPRLKIAIIRSLTVIGDSRAFAALERLAFERPNPLNAEVRSAALEALPAVAAAAQRQRERETLLRPASQLDDSLLRPASDAGQTDSTLLLRPGEAPHSG